MTYDIQQLNNLSEQEKQLVLQILNEYTEKGNSDKYTELLKMDYKEIPVDIETFLRDKQYLGTGLINAEGKFTIFPYWENMLKKLFPTNTDTAYNTLILSGAIGLGKSTIAVICLLYMLYRMMCLKDPYLYYGLQDIDLITFSFMNITMDAAKGVAWQKCQELLQSSPWFMARGRLSKALNPEWQPNQNIELIYGSQPRHVIGRAIVGSFEDEISFQQNQDISKQIAKAKSLISSIDARMQSRFMKGEKLPTLHILASSKRTDQSFLETYIETKKKNNSKTTLIIDEPQWVIRTDKDSPNKFKVALGNKFLDSEVLSLDITEQQLKYYIDRGYRILEVPMGYYENFLDDIDIALTDIAGISVTSSSKYISGVRIAQAKTDKYKNPFTKEIIVCGNASDDNTQYSDYFDLTQIPIELKYRPLFIHLDMSISGDKTGIGGSWIVGKKPGTKDLYFQTAFSVSIKAPKGYQISFEKHRQFIYWLKDHGFNIKGISSDTFQSADFGQSMLAKGYAYEIISVDRVDTNRICQPYHFFRSALYDGRIIMYENKLLTEELIGLERDNNSGRVDHSPSGINSKDQADGVVGSIYNASKHAEEYEFEYGEDLELIYKYNNYNTQTDINQLNSQFEQQMQQIFQPIIKDSELKKQSDQYLDFGFGASQPLISQYLSQGIII